MERAQGKIIDINQPRNYVDPISGNGDVTTTIKYTKRVCRFPNSIVTLACICMLALQFSGLHLHVGTADDRAEMHGTHLHQAVLLAQDHDHSTEVDVELLEQFARHWSKVIALISQVILLIMAVWILRPTWSPPLKSGKTGRRLHWRPLLRAPPLSL